MAAVFFCRGQERDLCHRCLLRSWLTSVWEDIWHVDYRLTDELLVKCAFDGCNDRYTCRLFKLHESVALFEPDQLQQQLWIQRIDGAYAYAQFIKYLRPSGFAPAGFSSEQRRLAGMIHMQLASMGGMRHLESGLDGDTGLMWVTVNAADRTAEVAVPLIESAIIRSKRRRSCDCCAGEFFPVDVEERTLDDAVFHNLVPWGDWITKLWPFPTPADLPRCAVFHDLNVCHECIKRYIASRIENLGMACCDDILCPSPGCHHILTYSEVMSLADGKTADRYEQLFVQRCLSGDPDFRWCLNPGCGSGQIVDTTRCRSSNAHSAVFAFQSNLFRCYACGFEMCYRHQKAWRAGGSAFCDECTSAQQQDEATEAFLNDHTKQCPRCMVNIIKGRNGCFHMTCSQCRHEFCWLCLADWSRIETWRRDRRQYNVLAHNQGCYFLRTDAYPWEVRGDSEADVRHQERRDPWWRRV
ncbi:E3 ubiquitin-protein ligase dbl4 [Colletotrichum trifolii]|uniref:RBR-type E3 ubiquitin transferase n=1 Tax=Colletotrichum trifolii TaxID=5466 RepID=A0A4R8RV79_COLTR|nr:E3 ubiquitin-protein ligase dbl4 [Colletotrichum trifolii]